MVFGLHGELWSKPTNPTPPAEVTPNEVSLTMEETLKRSLEFNKDILRKKLELVRTDSDLQKNEGKYTWRIVGGAEIDQKRLPFNQNNIFTGTKSQTNTYSTGIEKLLNTGTYFKFENKITRFDSNAFEDPLRTPSGFGALGLPPLYTDLLSVTISQDLIKNSFGVKDKNLEEILRNQTEINKERILSDLSEQLVQSLIDYWKLVIAENALEEYDKLRKNVVMIRDLTIQKQNLGLSESYEVNQWNALLAQAESQHETARLDRDEARRKIIKNLNLPEDTVFAKLPPLKTDSPLADLSKDIPYAFDHRADYRSIKKKKDIAELALKNAENDSLPTLKASGNFGYQAQNLISPQKNLTDGSNGVLSQAYPVVNGSLQFIYPINDPGAKASIRDAMIVKKQVSIEEQDLTKQVEDDVKNKVDVLFGSYKVFMNAEKSTKESKAYYQGVFRAFKQGRVNAIAVKNALDLSLQDEFNFIKAKVDYNINLHRYYLSKNSLFEEYNIKLEDVLPKEIL